MRWFFFSVVLFKFYDKDTDGRISRQEVADAMRLACPKLFPISTLHQVLTLFSKFTGPIFRDLTDYISFMG
jgi:Ca2+-binding EF-hand superfamily protein